MEKMIESATSAYIPKVEERAKARKAELEDMKVKVRTNPEQVEEWFVKEIDKATEYRHKGNYEKCDGRDLNPGYQIGNLMS